MAENSNPVSTPATPVATEATTTPKADAAAASPKAAPETATPPKAEAPKPPTAAEIRRMKLKMDGQEIDLPEEEVIKLAQQAGVSGRRFQEAAALRKQAEQVLELLQTKPAEALKKLVPDTKAYRQLLEDELTDIIKREAESPEQKKIREQEDQLKAYAEKERQVEEARKQKEKEDADAARTKDEQEKMEKYSKQYTEIFTKALDETGLPKNAYTMKRMAELQKVNLKKGLNLDASSLATIVKQDYDQEHNARLEQFKSPDGKFDGERLLAFFGEDIVKALSKAQIKRLKALSAQKFSTPVQEVESPNKPAEHRSWRDLQKKRRQFQA
jgi:hypothetical protein